MEYYSYYVIAAFSLAGVFMSTLAWQSLRYLQRQQKKLASLQDGAHEA